MPTSRAERIFRNALYKNTMAADIQHAHRLFDPLGPGQLAAVVHLLETMVSPDIVAHDKDGDTLSNAERKAVAEADEWLKQNRPIPHEEVLAGFGLTMTDWEKTGQGAAPTRPQT
jgi:hypothetical protein